MMQNTIDDILAVAGFCVGALILLNTIYELYIGKNSMLKSCSMAFLSGVLISWSFYMLN